jgi:glucose-1-phosphate cytidylyltransferase
MKAVILAGGYGTRISEETAVRPKPMVEIGHKPILWHIMKTYSHHGINDFIICCGYKGHLIKEFFANYFMHTCDITIDLRKHSMDVHENYSEPWKVSLIDTGEGTMTGGRLKRVAEYVGNETFCCTYGDGVGDIDISATVEFHRSQNVLATLTATQPPGRFGAFTLGKDEHLVKGFREKPVAAGAWVNGGYFVMEPEALNYIDHDLTVWEREPMERLARDGKLAAYKHNGFWQPMDSLRDKHVLEDLWESGKAPWKAW